MISFDPLKITLIKKKLSKTEFTELVGVSSATASKMWKDEYVALSVIDNICNVLEVPITDVIEHIPDSEASTNLHKVVAVDQDDVTSKETLSNRTKILFKQDYLEDKSKRNSDKK